MREREQAEREIEEEKGERKEEKRERRGRGGGKKDVSAVGASVRCDRLRLRCIVQKWTFATRYGSPTRSCLLIWSSDRHAFAVTLPLNCFCWFDFSGEIVLPKSVTDTCTTHAVFPNQSLTHALRMLCFLNYLLTHALYMQCFPNKWLTHALKCHCSICEMWATETHDPEMAVYGTDILIERYPSNSLAQYTYGLIAKEVKWVCVHERERKTEVARERKTQQESEGDRRGKRQRGSICANPKLSWLLYSLPREFKEFMYVLC